MAQGLDLNLLATLHALLEERSVSRAASQLNLTPSAVSHSLRRLRVVFNDELLVRAGQRLVLTPRAEALCEEVRDAVERAHAVFAHRSPTELQQETRTVVIQTDDSIVSAHGANLSARIHRQAPGVRLHFMGRTEEGARPLRDGTVHFDLGSERSLAPEIRSERVCNAPLVCVLRAGHPLAQARLTRKRYVEATHAVATRRSRAADPIDEVLHAAGLSRTVPVVVPDAITALAVAAGTDHLATVSTVVAEWGARTMKVQTLSLPFDVPPTEIILAWHPKHDRDPLHGWLLDCIRQTFAKAKHRSTR